MSRGNPNPREISDNAIHAVQKMIWDQFHFEPDQPLAICIFVGSLWHEQCESISRLGVPPSTEHPFGLATLPLVEARKLFLNKPDLIKELDGLDKTGLPFEMVWALFIDDNGCSLMALEPEAPSRP
jgi:hypothetical protein